MNSIIITLEIVQLKIATILQYQVLFKIVTMIINSWNRDWMSNNQNKLYIAGKLESSK